MRLRKTTSSSSPSSTPRAPGVNRYGRSGLDAQQFHSGPTAKTLVLKTDNPRRCKRCNHAPLISSRCPSCGLDHRAHQLARNHRRHRQDHIDDSALLGDDLDDPDEGLLGNREDDDAAD
jgi:hypothetical protein